MHTQLYQHKLKFCEWESLVRGDYLDYTTDRTTQKKRLPNKRRNYLRLFNSKVSVDTSIASSARQVLVLSVGNVKFGASITILLGQSKVNDKQL